VPPFPRIGLLAARLVYRPAGRVALGPCVLRTLAAVARSEAAKAGAAEIDSDATARIDANAFLRRIRPPPR
jgi:hypothetical protein